MVSLLRWSRVLVPGIAAAIIAALFYSNCGRTACSFFQDRLHEIASWTSFLLPKITLVLLLFLLFKIVEVVVLEQLVPGMIKKTKNPGMHAGKLKLSHFFFWLAFVISAISILVGDLAKLASSVGLIGLGLTFALQKPIINFVGWLTIITKGIYREGDRVRVGNIIGDVREVQLMNTVLWGLLESSTVQSNKTVTFPNEMVLTMDVQNYTKDSNYVLDELSVTITYESDYHKAMSILMKIIEDHIRQNKASYMKKVASQKNKIERFISKVLLSQGNDKKLVSEAERLKQDKDELDKEVRQLEELEEEFRPKVRVELQDSGIQLIAHFLTPYDQVKKSRTDINLAFLDAIKYENSIQLAYPHMQLVTH